jgi:hypothetical protein
MGREDFERGEAPQTPLFYIVYAPYIRLISMSNIYHPSNSLLLLYNLSKPVIK